MSRRGEGGKREPATADEIIKRLVVLVRVGIRVEEENGSDSLDPSGNLPESLVLHNEL
jgi:hypothetical protein